MLPPSRRWACFPHLYLQLTWTLLLLVVKSCDWIHRPLIGSAPPQAMFETGCSFGRVSSPDATAASKAMPLLSLPGWLQLLRSCRLLDSGLLRSGPGAGGTAEQPGGGKALIAGVSEHDAVAIFCWSRMAVVTESLSPHRLGLTWADFLEALARLADLVGLPWYSVSVLHPRGACQLFLHR